MNPKFRRRQFLQSASVLGLGTGLGADGLLRAITPARAADMRVTPDSVRFRSEIEPIVRWIEETPRNRILEVAVQRLKGGLAYRDLLAGLFLAGIRNVKPRPVGFKFHAVLVINSAHLLGQAAAEDDRLLPLFWALDTFKNSQAQDEKEGDWSLLKVDDGRLPSTANARIAFENAMEAWDSEAGDVATAALCRTTGAAETMEAFWRVAVRDQRSIGHKPIFAMQCWRTLQAIGWQHAEPVMRSLAYGLLDLNGDRKAGPIGPYEANLVRAREIRPGWQAGKPDAGATRSLLATMRTASADEASAEAAAMLGRGVSPDSIWDAVVLGSGELMVRKPGIVPIHAVTASNALHFIYNASGDETTRKLALLQAVGWQPLYRAGARTNDGFAIDEAEGEAPGTAGEEAVAEIFDVLGKDRRKGVNLALGHLARGGAPDALFSEARRLIFRKGTDSHDYKFGAATWEEFHLAGDPKWQAPLAAAALANAPGTSTPDSPLMKRAREAVAEMKG